MAPAIPERWLNYIPIGQQIEGTQFIAFKVPLREHVNVDVDEENRLDGKILLQAIPNLGMIIDLTNTTRYYDPQFFEKEGIEYRKLMIPGHHTPPPYLVKRFKAMAKSFLKHHPDNDKLIGVHCTHGVNRTGYLICNYMISELNMEPNQAMQKFAEARGHKIERENYLDSLKNLKKRTEIRSTGNNETLSWRRASTILPPPSSLKKRTEIRSTGNNEPLSWRRASTILPSLSSREVLDERNRFSLLAGLTQDNGYPNSYNHNNYYDQLTQARDGYYEQRRCSQSYLNKSDQRVSRNNRFDAAKGERVNSRYRSNKRI